MNGQSSSTSKNTIQKTTSEAVHDDSNHLSATERRPNGGKRNFREPDPPDTNNTFSSQSFIEQLGKWTTYYKSLTRDTIKIKQLLFLQELAEEHIQDLADGFMEDEPKRQKTDDANLIVSDPESDDIQELI